jgi:hypothetical protein
MIDVAELQRILHYDPETGLFTWRRVWGSNARPKDRPAGRPTQRYWQISINYRRYQAHRLAFLYMTGEWPVGEIDHIDRDGFNNRWSNLRLVTHAENMRNKLASAGSVIYIPSRKRWRARIGRDGRRVYLGDFETEEAARAALLPKLLPNF